MTGPNEYENNVNNNRYTNYLAKWCIDYTLEQIEKVEIEYQNRQVDVVRDELIRKFSFTSGRMPQWLHVRLRDIAFLSNTEPIITGTGTNYKLDSNLRVTDYNKNQEVDFERFGGQILVTKLGFMGGGAPTPMHAWGYPGDVSRRLHMDPPSRILRQSSSRRSV